MSSQVRLRILPSAKCLFDEAVQVRVNGLQSRQLITVKAASTDDKGVSFRSAASYRADGKGEVDLQRDTSLGGSYTGVEPMGLFWALKPDTMHTKFFKISAQKPHFVHLSVHEGEGSGMPLAEATNERRLLADGVSRIPVKDGDIRGVLFTPPGKGPFPSVLDLYTFGSGLSEKRACLLANLGFMVLTVSLYGMDDQPKKVQKLHLDYFEEAVQFLRRQPMVEKNGVGVISLSKSSDIALSIATYLPNIAATVWINGCSANTIFPLYYKGSKILSPLLFDHNKVKVTASGAVNTKNAVLDPLSEINKGSMIPIEQAETNFLFVVAEDDQNWDSYGFMMEMTERLKRHGKLNYEKVIYPGAGHYLEPPYGPYCPSSFHGVLGKPVEWGGEAGAHAAAEVHLWKKIQDFFRTHLTRDGCDTKARL